MKLGWELMQEQYGCVLYIIMKFTHNLTESYSPIPYKPLYSSASSKMFVGQSQFQSCQVQKGRVSMSVGELSRQVKNYEWRNTTEFPIVRVRTWQIINSNNEKAEVQIYYESIPIVLQQIQQVPLFKMLYLLKEVLIGYERIFNRFGPCQITSKMIGINQFYRCKVWVNQDFASNSYQPLHLDQREGIVHICKLLQQKTAKSKNSINFYSELIKCSHFSAFLYFVDHYAKDNKIAIPSFFKHQKITPLTTYQKDQAHKFHPNLTMNRSPKFINNMRDTLPSAFNRRQLLQENKQAKQAEGDNVGLRGKDIGQELCLKTSGQTKADIYGSSTIADSKCKESYFLQAHHFPVPHNQPQNLQKSQLLQFKAKGEKKPRLTHKITNKQMFSCFTPQPRSCQFLNSPSNWDDSSFFQPMNTISQVKDQPKRQSSHSVEQQDTLVHEFQNLFERNHWEQKIGGLFNEEQQQMKKSLTEGEQPKWKDQHGEELTLLKHFGKMVFQSSCPVQREPTR